MPGDTKSDKPIIFSGPMVLAILAGTKTQTRRVIKPQPKTDWLGYMLMENGNALLNGPDYPDGDNDEVKIPYRVGQRLWVRESFMQYGKAPPITQYKADGGNFKWKSPIHMPRSASRINLEVTKVRVQRVHEIGKDGRKAKDVLAEGIEQHQIDKFKEWFHPDDCPALAYAEVWEKINGKKYPWKSNPWVVAYTFRRV